MKRILSLLLIFCMVFSMLTTYALDGVEEPNTDTKVAEELNNSENTDNTDSTSDETDIVPEENNNEISTENDTTPPVEENTNEVSEEINLEENSESTDTEPTETVENSEVINESEELEITTSEDMFQNVDLMATGEVQYADTVILYEDGTLVFQHGETPISEHGNIIGKWTEAKKKFNTRIFADYKSNPWYSYRFSITSVDFVALTKPISTAYWFYECKNLTNIKNISKLDTSNVTTMNVMFQNCSSLTSLDVSKFDTSKVTNMQGMFQFCSSLTSLDVSGFNTSNVTNMGSMFQSCSSLTPLDVSGFNTSNVTNMACMFYGCSGLTSLDVSKFDTSNVTYMSSMFYDCSNLTSLDVSKFDTSKVIDMRSMFYHCSNLTSLDVSKFDTPEVMDLGYMFNGCSNLTSLNLSKINTTKVVRMDYMFYECTNLSSLTLGPNWKWVTTLYSLRNVPWYDLATGIEYTATTIPSNKAATYVTELPNLPFLSAKYTVQYHLQNLENDKYTLNTAEIIESTGTTDSTVDAEIKTFIGFHQNTSKGNVSGTITGDGSLVLNVYYDRDTYNVSYKDGIKDEPIVSLTNIKHGYTLSSENLAKLAEVEAEGYRPGYTFNGWSVDKTAPITSPIDVTANWIANQYTLTFDVNTGDALPEENRTKTVTFGSSYEDLPTATKTGYSFMGWYTSAVDGDKIETTTTVITASDTTLYAHWNANNYKVTFTVKDDESLDEADKELPVTYNQPYGTLPTPEKTGYTFDGWTINGSKITNETVMNIADNISAEATWTANKYTITYDLNNGTMSGSDVSKEVTYNQPYGELPEPTRKGYTFAGWKIGDTIINSGSKVEITSNSTAVAQWTPGSTTYKVEHYQQNLDNDDYAVYETEDLTGTTNDTATAIAKTYTGFTEDTDNASKVSTGTITADGNLTLKLYYNRNKYKVEYKDGINDTPILSLPNVKYGYVLNENELAELAKVKTEGYKPGYTFNGWSVDETAPITSPINATVNWVARTYTITYNPNNGTMPVGSNTSKEVTYDSTYGELPTPTRTGYDFTNWTINGNVITAGTTVDITTDTEILANWTAKSYTLTFDTDGGTLPEGTETTKPVTYNSAYGELPNPSKPGYDFTGWTVNNVPVNKDTIVKVTENSNIKATWTPSTYTITYNVNGGTMPEDSAASKDVVYGSTYGDLPTPEKEGYNFSGWTINGNPVNEDTTVNITADTEIIANWTAKNDTKYTVQHYKQDVRGDGYGEVITETLAGTTNTEATATPQTYEGFHENTEHADRISTHNIDSNNNAVLKLYYDRDVKTVKYINDGTSVIDTTVRYEDTVEVPEVSKLGYTFAGWFEGETQIDTDAKITTNIDAVAKWTPNSNTAYKVEYYKQDVRGNGYSEIVTETLEGTTNTEATATPQTYEGFHENTTHTDRIPTHNIDPDGNTVLKLYYDRDIKTVKYTNDGATIIDTIVRYGDVVEVPEQVKPGYTLTNWVDVEGNTVDPSAVITTDIDATTVWEANKYKVALDVDSEAELPEGTPTEFEVTYDETYEILPTPTKPGYDFAGWFDANNNKVEPTDTVKTLNDLTLHTEWVARNDIAYKVNYYLQNTTLDGYNKDDALTHDYTGTTDSEVSVNNDADIINIEGFHFVDDHASNVKTGIINADGSTELSLYYDRNIYNLTLNTVGGTLPEGEEAKTVIYGLPYGPLPTPTKEGYTFVEWTDENGNKVDENTIVGVNPNIIANYTINETVDKTLEVTDDENRPLNNTLVTIKKGNTEYRQAYTDVNGKVSLDGIEPGHYNAVINDKASIKTIIVYIPENVQDEVITDKEGGTVNSILNVEENSKDVVVGGLNEIKNNETLYTEEDKTFVDEGGKVAFVMNVENIPVETAEERNPELSTAVKEDSKKATDYMEINVNKVLADNNGEQISSEQVTDLSPNNLLEIHIPLTEAQKGKTGYVVYLSHDGEVYKITETPDESGAYIKVMADEIIVYTSKFSEYCLAYDIPTHKITFDASEGTLDESKKEKTVKEEDVYGELPVPTRSGYTFDGWYKADGTTKVDENTVYTETEDMTLKAHWTKNKVSGGGSTGSGGGVGGGSSTPSISSKPTTPTSPYDDVKKPDWFYKEVLEAIDKEYIEPVSKTKFNPNGDLDRKSTARMFAKLLKAKSTDLKYSAKFNDVLKTTKYANEITWADNNKVMIGYGDGNFGPDDSLTREQFALILFRVYYDSKTNFVGHWEEDMLDEAEKVSSWARDAMCWAVGNGIIKGNENGELMPQKSISRAEACAIIIRFENNKK